MVYIYNETNKGRETVHAWRSSQSLQGGNGKWAEDIRTKDSLFTITTPKKKSWKREERLLLKRPHTYIMNKN